jgi:hypothetical protein
LVTRSTRLNRITDGRASSRAASKSPKSMSEEMIIRASSMALARTSESGALCRPISHRWTASWPACRSPSASFGEKIT